MIKQLNIQNYTTYFTLGNEASEKRRKRKIIIDISLRFLEKNNACISDDIDETVCYSQLLDFIDEKLKNVKFNLLEKVTQFLYEAISEYLDNVSILKRVEVTKPYPPVKNLANASFICSDW
ncbi:MAG: dihydroneopterin aldolase [Holosporaceae bacterium]|jgi:dihydroneopterin aldolase|nr:dihydroneopterin aldolase [Holosporaceae bacterium]